MAAGLLIRNWKQQSIPPAFDASGVFETCRVEKGQLLSLEKHLLRLKHSLQTVGIFVDLEQEVSKRLREAAAGLKTGFVRVAIRRQAPRGDSQILIYRHVGTPYTKRQMEQGLDLTTSATRWPLGEASPAQAKGSERLSSVLSRQEAGMAPETLRIGPLGYLTEGTASNLFLVSKDQLVTPPSWLGVLEGVTREQIIQAAQRLKWTVEQRPITRHELFNADEAFMTNVLMPVFPIQKVDGRRIGTKTPGPKTKKLMQVVLRKPK